MSGEKKLLSHTLMLGVSSVISKVAVFLLMPLYTNYLTPADFGTADILVVTATLLIPLASLEAPDAIFRFLAGGEEEGSVLMAGCLFTGLGCLAFALIFPLFSFSAVLMPYRGHLFFYVTASVARSFVAHWVQARGEYGLAAIQQLFCTLLTVLLEILFLPVFEMGVGGYLLATVLADGVTFLILLFYLASRQCGGWHWRGDLARRMLVYALPLMPAAVLRWVNSSADRYILMGYRGEESIGLFAAAGRIPAVLTFGVALFMEAWHYAVLREPQRTRGVLFDRIYRIFLPCTVLFTGSVILTSRFLVSKLYAPEYAEAATLVPLLAISTLFSGAAAFLGSIYTLYLRSANILVTAGAGALLNILFNFLLVPRWGGVGAGVAAILSHSGVFLLRARHCPKLLNFAPRVGKLCLSCLFLIVALLPVGNRIFGWRFFAVGLALMPFLKEWKDMPMTLVNFLKNVLKKRQKKRR